MTSESTPAVASPAWRVRQIQAFSIILAMVVAGEFWSRAIRKWEHLDGFLMGAVAAVTLFAGIVCLSRWHRLGFGGLSVTLAVVVTWFFPATGNHEYLELVFCLLFLVLDPRRPGEGELLVSSVRWLVCIVLFWAGVQKLVHGLYFEGEHLAYSLSRETYRNVFSLLLPAKELSRLTSYSGNVGSGPYRASGLQFLVISNLTYIVEITVVPALLWRPTRKLAIGATIVTLIAIQSAAREFFFCLVLGNALLLFLDSDANRKLIGPMALLLVCLLLMRAGILPEVTFS